MSKNRDTQRENEHFNAVFAMSIVVKAECVPYSLSRV